MVGWHRRSRQGRRRRAALALLAIGVVAGAVRPASAQVFYETLESSALAIAAFEASRDRCRYSAKLGGALAAIDAYLARAAGAAWTSAKQAAPQKLVVARNMGRVLGAASDCAGYGAAIGVVLPVYFHAADLEPEVVREFGELARSGGRSMSGEAEARPPQPPLPGSAAAIMADYNRQHPNQNRSADTGGHVSSLGRLPGDEDRARVIGPRPPVAQPAVSPNQPGAATEQDRAAPPSRLLEDAVVLPSAPPSVSPAPARSSPPSEASGRSVVAPAGDPVATMRAARGGRIDVPIIIGGDERLDACTGAGHIVGLDPRGDGFLSVRSGPGGRPYSELDRLYNGNTVTICVERGPWLGVVYGPRALDCNTGTPWPTRMPYTGPCRAGWIHSRYVKITVG